MSVNDPMMESKHHDPMLDGITRWKSDGFDEMAQIANAEYVLFSDLPALLAAAREDERGKTIVSYDLMKQRKGYEQGQRDEREACIAAVEAHIRADLTEQEMFCGRKSDLIAALRARRAER